MNLRSLNPHYRAALVLIVMAGILLVTAVLTNRGDFTSAALVMASTVCLLTGVFVVTLSESDPLDLRYLGLLPVQGSINLSHIGARLGIQGNAHIIPKGKEGRDQTVQFVPVAEYGGTPLSTDIFVTNPETAGLLMNPSCLPLLNLLREREHLVIPPDMASLDTLVQEIGVDVLEVADQVHPSHEEEIITIRLENFRLISGCRAMARESPRCCITNPCPICSLFATLFSEGTGKIIKIERCEPDLKNPTVTAVLSVIPE